MSFLLPRRIKAPSAPSHSTLQNMPSPEQAQQAPNSQPSQNKSLKARLYDSREKSSSVSDTPVVANYDSSHLTIGAGVAIFHLASSRVVLCYHSTHHYWFLPKGRRDAGEESTGRGAEREGFEESGYRNRLLPLPMAHRQPQSQHTGGKGLFATEAVWMQLAPVSRSAQYVLFWYVAETLPPTLDQSLTKASEVEGMRYHPPPAFPKDVTLKKRMAMEPEGYEPVRHENTGVDDEEALYTSCLVGMEEAVERLGRGSISADVVRRGWEGIERRKKMEER